MPVTPLHFGPGLLVKALLPRSFSFVAFALANVIVDAEVLFHMIRGDSEFHGYFHTYLIAPGIGVVAGLLTFVASRFVDRMLPADGRASRWWRTVAGGRLLGVCLVSGMLGSVSHVFLDSLVHRGLHPLLPFSLGGNLKGIFSKPEVDGACALAGLVGLALWLALQWRGSVAGRTGQTQE